MIFVGIDWAEEHHDVCLLDAEGVVLANARVPDGAEGARRLRDLVARHAASGSDVVVGIEIDRDLLVGSLIAAGYDVYAINPLAASRYRDRHVVSGAKSDRGDAKMLADLVRTDRHNHRPVAGDSELAEAMKVLARSHQALIWSRQREVNRLRNALRDFYPAALAAFGNDLASTDAVAVLRRAPTPAEGRALSALKIRTALQRGGRQRNLDKRATEIREILRGEYLQAPVGVVAAYRAAVLSAVAVIAGLTEQIAVAEKELASAFGRHPDATILRSLPGLGTVLGARILGEFGDEPERYANPKARKNYAGTAPVTRASGTKVVVLSRSTKNRRLSVAAYLWAFAALSHSPGARRYYDLHRSRGKTHRRAIAALANRLVGILHGCLAHRELYSEAVAWPALEAAA